MTENIISIDKTMCMEIYKAIDKVFMDFEASEMERMTLSTLYAIEKQQYIFVQMLPHYFNKETWDVLKQRFEKANP